VSKGRSRDTVWPREEVVCPREEAEIQCDQWKKQRHSVAKARSRDIVWPRQETETQCDQEKSQRHNVTKRRHRDTV
jgi:hypothetical protein